MVVFTTAMGLWLAPGSIGAARTVLLLFGTALLVGSANTLNCWYERETDGLMNRTRNRPLPAGRLDPSVALALGIVGAAFAIPILSFAINPLTALLGAIAHATYVLVYTPLKKVSPWALEVGAIPGAIPPLMGWTAATGTLSLPGWFLFGILFFWQIPHFLAIAIYLEADYRRGGFKVFSVERGPGDRGAVARVLHRRARRGELARPAARAGGDRLHGFCRRARRRVSRVRGARRHRRRRSRLGASDDALFDRLADRADALARRLRALTPFEVCATPILRSDAEHVRRVGRRTTCLRDPSEASAAARRSRLASTVALDDARQHLGGARTVPVDGGDSGWRIRSTASSSWTTTCRTRRASNLAKYAAIEAFAREQGIEFHGAGSGIGHQIVIERGLARPGELCVAADSHANMYGAAGALGVAVSRSDAAGIWAAGMFWWEVPPTVRVVLEGTAPGGRDRERRRSRFMRALPGRRPGARGRIPRTGGRRPRDRRSPHDLEHDDRVGCDRGRLSANEVEAGASYAKTITLDLADGLAARLRARHALARPCPCRRSRKSGSRSRRPTWSRARTGGCRTSTPRHAR